MKTKIALLLLIAQTFVCFSQKNLHDSVSQKQFVSTSLWSIANLFADPADIYELNYGLSFSTKNTIIANATTWKYPEPLGIPLNHEKKYKHIEDFPGYVRAIGIGIAYQRFLWKNAYSSIHANTFLQNFYDVNNVKIQSGFQLYLQARVGYRIEFWNNRLFLEPSLSFIYRPIETNFPDSFQKIENKWPNYLLFEPHVNIGIKF